MKIRIIGFFVLTMSMAILFGCGGGGGGALQVVQPTKAIVKMATNGTLPAGTTIGGIDATLTYATNKGLSIAASDVAVSGSGSGSFMAANTTTTAGQVRLGLVSTGIQAGEFATLTFGIAAGNSPVAGDFAVAPGANVIDSNTNSATLSGITVEILSVTFQ